VSPESKDSVTGDWNVLVTGAAGVLGSQVVEAALKTGAAVAGATRSGIAKRLEQVVSAKNFTRVDLDICDAPSVERLFGGQRFQAVIHCAGYGSVPAQADAQRMVDVNVSGTVRLYLAAAEHEVERFIHVGTAFEYGPHSGHVTEDSPLIPVGSYGASKAAATAMLAERSRNGVLRPLVVRLFNLFGPHDHASRIATSILAAARTGEPLRLTAGKQKRDFMYGKDAARALAALAVMPRGKFPAGALFNLSSGSPLSVREFAEAFAQELRVVHLLQFGEISERADAPSDLYALPERWRRFCLDSELDALLQLTPFARAVRECADAEAPASTDDPAGG
jgi:nucleoside-diphosphate-sugar epimerase